MAGTIFTIGRRIGVAVDVARLRARWSTRMLVAPSGSFVGGRVVPISVRQTVRQTRQLTT